MLRLFATTMFASAMLLFMVQPLFTRMATPLLGGAPAVWNVAVVFFQATLLAGYAYAHWISRQPIRRQLWIHGVLLFVPLAILPLGIPEGCAPPANADPTVWFLGLLARVVGPPFFIVSTTSPLIQKWFSQTRHPLSGDPYFLYSSSNAGSLLALIGYPLLMEPLLSLQAQAWVFSAGYGLLIALVLASAIWTLQCKPRAESTSAPPAVEGGLNRVDASEKPAPSIKRKALWILFAMAPSSLMLGTTNYIAADIASAPLLWILPLSLYLITFIQVFSRRLPAWEVWGVRLFRITLLIAVFTLATDASGPILILIPLHLANFYLGAYLCHLRLARSRPDPAWLTQFYFCLSVGGVLGGIFNSLLAPAIFDGVAEYPIGLALTCFLALRNTKIQRRASSLLRALGIPALIGVWCGVWVWISNEQDVSMGWAAQLLMFGLPLIFCFMQARHPLRFTLSLAAVMIAGAWHEGEEGRIEHRERSFFGVHRVGVDASGRFRQLLHGRTLHGWQSLDEREAEIPMAYYHSTGPIGQILNKTAPALQERVAVIGLGVGALAAYARENQRWTFYEIDPVVERIARDPRFFTYLSEARGEVRVVLGDARLTLRDAPDHGFGLIILDAYSSDAIPIHLVTREALRLYLKKLAPGGLLAFHLSNRNLDLEQVLCNLALDAGLIAMRQDEIHVTQREYDAGKLESKWMVMARDRANLGLLPKDARWHEVEGDPGQRVWTDDYASIVTVINWK